MGILIITHHDKLLENNVPDFTHVMLGGRIVETGGVELAQELHRRLRPHSRRLPRRRGGRRRNAAREAANTDRALPWLKDRSERFTESTDMKTPKTSNREIP
jgi:ABC-type dipeptide/oligopeptide/nickel transport system ATPase component